MHSDDEVKLRRKRPGTWHVFLSHAWRSGQDQAKTLKLSLQELLPQVQVYLDVDSALGRKLKKTNSLNFGAIRLDSPTLCSPDHKTDWMQAGVTSSTIMVALLTGGSKERSATLQANQGEAGARVSEVEASGDAANQDLQSDYTSRARTASTNCRRRSTKRSALSFWSRPTLSTMAACPCVCTSRLSGLLSNRRRHLQVAQLRRWSKLRK